MYCAWCAQQRDRSGLQDFARRFPGSRGHMATSKDTHDGLLSIVSDHFHVDEIHAPTAPCSTEHHERETPSRTLLKGVSWSSTLLDY